jgi:hypothetical protein
MDVYIINLFYNISIKGRRDTMKIRSMAYYLFIAFAFVLLLTGNPYTVSGFVAMAIAVAAIIIALVGLYIQRKNNEDE